MDTNSTFSFQVLMIIALLLVIVALSGCTTFNADKLSPTSTSSVCGALIGPIEYNSTNPKSARHAGTALAPDLKKRNQVGQNLGCPAYK